ncbi:hypothetical protein [Flectobacillus longus]|uniref:hypothetical protein n=1 Tax=Flectobacillus longus TaxID=2984207 RepID=UPI0024B84765|nr:hypothetical protein [Flectobacillus longus]MDI9878388.1 hypothetical protein [Flectobacillus longus]
MNYKFIYRDKDSGRIITNKDIINLHKYKVACVKLTERGIIRDITIPPEWWIDGSIDNCKTIAYHTRMSKTKT